jgi:hypothetical protein
LNLDTVRHKRGSHALDCQRWVADREWRPAQATLGDATVNAMFMAGSYFSRQYTILNASGGIGGAFDAVVTSNMSNIQSTLSCDAENVFLNIRPSFVPPGAI